MSYLKLHMVMQCSTTHCRLHGNALYWYRHDRCWSKIGSDQVMACFLATSSHFLNQWWYIVNCILAGTRFSHLFSTKPLSEPILDCCKLGPKEHISMHFIQQIKDFIQWNGLFIKMDLKMLSAKYRSLWLGLRVLRCVTSIHPPIG